MVEHIKILALFHILWSLMWLFFAAVTVFIMVVMFGILASTEDAELASLLIFGYFVRCSVLPMGPWRFPASSAGLRC